MANTKLTAVLTVATSLAAVALLGLAIISRAQNPTPLPAHTSTAVAEPIVAEGFTEHAAAATRPRRSEGGVALQCQRITSVICMVVEPAGIATVSVMVSGIPTPLTILTYEGCPTSVAATFKTEGAYSLDIKTCEADPAASDAPVKKPANTDFADWIRNPSAVPYSDHQSPTAP